MEQDKTDQSQQETHSSFIKMKKFKFVMLLFFLVFATAGITTFALAFGDEKAVNVGVTERSEFQKLYEAYDKLNENYFKDLDQDTLVNGAINGMLDSVGDPYSDYMNVEEAEKFQESISSSFEGIGAEIQEKEGYISIVSPIKGSPAEKAGLQPNDTITKVDDKSIQGMSVTDAVLLIRGEKGTKVTLTIQRPGQDKPMQVTITRDEIPIETVYAEMKENGVAEIQITSFSESTYKELTEALNDMNDKGMKKLVLDLRQNPGGLLDQAVKISNLFVPEGEVLFQVEDSNGKVEKYVSESGQKVDVPTAVLVDGGSASAAEILAAAVSESNDIPLVGTKTFGKGTVQTAETFQDGSNMKFTTAKWLTPDGNWIHEKGVTPDIEVKMPEYAKLPYINPEKELKESDLSDQVKTAEQMLNALDLNPGNVDGYYDEDTTKAVKQFQEKNELEVTGTLNAETTVKLMSNLRDKLKENDPQVKKAIEELNKNN
ncbi:lmo1851 family serine protease [Rossellomorea yichunensis]|uniref:lmo1851 family serine protease n=1 Tax=Rossellomorea yichunensis TaxID=3077331 RepID=UPI0028DFAA04|nr:S41 family peptidase [Rossellomorea sp. YC4-1]MDT9024534.1 S41 family peptidase [Rossellomorea sp. YC4-1]